MKNKLISIGLVLITTTSINAAITFSGTAGATLRDKDGNAINGGHAMIIVDTTGIANLTSDGFLNASTNGSGFYTAGSTTGIVASANPKVLVANAGLSAGSYFGGDYILATGTITSTGNIAFSGSININDYQSKNFAVVYFAANAATLAASTANAYYGIFAGSDWVFPATPNQTASFSPSSFSASTAYAQLSAAPTAAQIGTLGFFTGSGVAGGGTPGSKQAIFQVVPEPSAALLGAVGALLLLRRRRI